MSNQDTGNPQGSYAGVPAPVITALRYLGTFVGGAITVAAGINVITPDVAHKLTDALPALINGLTTVAGALSTIAGIALAAYGTWSSTRRARIAAVAADPVVAKVVTTTTALADSIPSTKVVSQ